jgi:ketosteroid isomerase-like protein
VQTAGDVALVRGTADLRAVGPSGPVDVTLAYLAAWVRHDGAWQLLAYQSARAAP